ncbi:LIM/homeobox protein Lhx6 isoform X1 [Tupaia chinensis]|uniref:LIM/homeobox protein Lhx6 isoform X1 n=1 Tax=Tupaia chinensis TaxID=246437 RepID=UPI0003C908B4|nr:LIM/homeobox protein Lhx6 isoform X1 [Tupaia chinensis]
MYAQHSICLLTALCCLFRAVCRQEYLLQLRSRDPGSVSTQGQQPHLARAMPRVLRVPNVVEAAEQLLHQEQGDLLQDGLLQPIWDQVCPVRPTDIRQRLGAASARQRLPPGLLRLLLLQAPAVHRRGVRLGGGEGVVPHPLRHHDREPQEGRRERERSHVGGGSALGTGQSAQAGQARADVLHRRAVAGYAGAVRAGQQSRRSDAAEAGGYDGPQPKGHPGCRSRCGFKTAGRVIKSTHRSTLCHPRGRPRPASPPPCPTTSTIPRSAVPRGRAWSPCTATLRVRYSAGRCTAGCLTPRPLSTSKPIWMGRSPTGVRRSSFFSTDTAGTSASVHGHPTAAPQPLRSSVPAVARDPPVSAATPARHPARHQLGHPGLAFPSPAENQNPPGAPQSPPLGRQSSLKFGIRVKTTACFFHLNRSHLQLKLITIAKGTMNCVPSTAF